MRAATKWEGQMGRKIRAIRLVNELTGGDVAKALQISRPYYTQPEGGRRCLSAVHARPIALALDVLVEPLFGEKQGGRTPLQGTRSGEWPMEQGGAERTRQSDGPGRASSWVDVAARSQCHPGGRLGLQTGL